MVRYSDPESEDTSRVRKRRTSPGERLRQIREHNSALTGEEAYEAAREAALRLLDRRDYASAMLEQKLIEKGFSGENAASVVARLGEVGLVNDRAYAEALARTRFDERGLVGRALQLELTRKGIPTDLASEVIASEITSDANRDVFDRALELARRKYQSSPKARAYARTTAYLARRGYSPSVITQVVRVCVDEDQQP